MIWNFYKVKDIKKKNFLNLLKYGTPARNVAARYMD